jgi:hypothetical protein
VVARVGIDQAALQDAGRAFQTPASSRQVHVIPPGEIPGEVPIEDGISVPGLLPRKVRSRIVHKAGIGNQIGPEPFERFHWLVRGVQAPQIYNAQLIESIFAEHRIFARDLTGAHRQHVG